MKKGCCTINVEEIEDGFRVEVTGEDVKEKCKTALETCCSEKMKSMHTSCCSSKE